MNSGRRGTGLVALTWLALTAGPTGPAAAAGSTPAAAAASAAQPPAVSASAADGAASAPSVAVPGPAATPRLTLLLRPPNAPVLLWRGMLATEGGAVGSGPQMGPYPVAGAAGLLAAILTHAAISEGVKSAEQKRVQAEADNVLEPYLPALVTWQAAQLWHAVSAQATTEVGLALAAPGEGPPSATAVVVLPSFTLSQDETMLIADVALRFEGGDATTSVERLVRVVSSPLPTTDSRAHWLADEARALKQTTAAMVAHAVQLGYRQLRSPAPEAPARTHRYLRGKSQGLERGHLLHSDCSRLVVQTLRGHLLSVPRAEADSEACPQSPGF